MTCAVIGIGRTGYSRKSGRTTRGMAVAACRDAIADAGLTPADIDGICTYMANDSEQPIAVGWALGIDELSWANAMYGGGNLVADQIATAAAVIEAGLCRAVLVYRSLNGRSGYRFGSIEGPMRVAHDNQFDTASGFLVPPQWFAMWARRHQYEYGSTCEDLGQIAITQRAHAGPNEHAIRREPLSMDDYLAARWINEPFRVLDCTSEVDGAVAILIAGEDIARDAGPAADVVGRLLELPKRCGLDRMGRPHRNVFAHRRSEDLGQDRADTGRHRRGVHVRLLHVHRDGHHGGLRLLSKGVRSASSSPPGAPPMAVTSWCNPHGGLLSEGYIHGLNHHYEAALQLRHSAGNRQVDNAQLALVTAGGGPFGGANVYSREHP